MCDKELTIDDDFIRYSAPGVCIIISNNKTNIREIAQFIGAIAVMLHDNSVDSKEDLG